MKRFRNILVPVDLSGGDVLVSDRLGAPSEQAVRDAVWLAGIGGARLRFFHALDLSDHTRQLIETDRNVSKTVLGQAERALAALASRAAAAGVEADARVAFGKSWLEAIRLVQRDGHDLVVAGSRDRGRLRTVLFGNTGMRLLRKCPCPVWLTRPRVEPKLGSVVVASDLSPVSDLAVDLAASMAALQGAGLTVVHALQPTSEEALLRAGVTPAAARATGEERPAAEAELRRQLGRPAVAALERAPGVRLVAGDAGEAILETLRETRADLLVMATIARPGLAGVLMGGTAERILAEVECSVLALKPEGFVTPVRPEV